MSYINPEIFDQGLDYADTNGTRLDICSQEPTTYAGATSTHSLGNATVNTGATENGAVDGRRVLVPAVPSLTATANGTATHWALTNGSNILLATGPLATPLAVTLGTAYSTAAFSIGIRAPA